MFTGATSHILILLASAIVTAGLAGSAWRRSEHGTRSFVGLMIAFTIYSAAQFMGLLTPIEPVRVLLDKFQWIGTAFVPLFWVLFALEYTGFDEVLTRKTVGLLSVIPLLTVLIAWTNPWHALMWTQNSLEVVEGLAVLNQAFGPWFWVYVVYSYAMIIVGIMLFIRLVWLSEQLYLDQSVLLIIGAAAPLTASILTVLDVSLLQNPTLDMTPYGFIISSLSFGYAIFRHQLFDVVPATRQLGRRSALQDLKDAVLIVDTDQRVIYCNPAASSLLNTAPDTITGQSIRSVIETDSLDFGADEAFAELERDGSVYEVRVSPIYNRRSKLVGHTLLISDITERRNRLRELEAQREELQRLEVLNSVLRGVNRVLVSATTREEIEREVCDYLAASELYQTVFIADLPTWRGNAERWTIAGERRDSGELSEILRSDDIGPREQTEPTVKRPESAASGDWAIVPLLYRRTVYGVIGLRSAGGSMTEEGSREREILAELGATIGHSINAVENQRLVRGETTIELEFRSRDETAPLLRAAKESGSQAEVQGLVPDGGQQPIAYIDVTGSPDQTADSLADAASGSVRTVRTDDDEGLLEWTVPEKSLLWILTQYSLSTLQITVTQAKIECLVEVASEQKMRTLMDELEESFPDTKLAAKRKRDRNQPFEPAEGMRGTVIDELTDRQREALKTAYRAGYFEWPRESSAEDVAETLDISRPTFQGHLRKAEDTLLTALFDSE